MKVLFACGGSGGHITPAIAMAQMLSHTDARFSCAFVGNENGMERRRAAEEGIPFHPLAIEGLHRSLTFRNLRTLFLAMKAPHAAKRILKSVKPDLVIGTGGYVSYPVIPAARKLGIPALLYEPNAIPGLAVRLTEKDADAVLLQFDACAERLKYRERARVIGAPLREGFLRRSRAEARAQLGIERDAFMVLCFGGSLGAESISRAVSDTFSRLGAMGVTLFHACGERLFERLKIKHPNEVKAGALLPYISDMATYMAAANVVVCRAGAMTLAELSRIGRAAILIPSPYVAENHQEKNARLYEARGAALLLSESALTADLFAERILFLKKNPSLLLRMEKNAAALGSPNTEERLRLAIDEVFKSRGLPRNIY